MFDACLFYVYYSEEWRQLKQIIASNIKQLNVVCIRTSHLNKVYIGAILLHKSVANWPTSSAVTASPKPLFRHSSFTPMRILPTHVLAVSRLMIWPGFREPVSSLPHVSLGGAAASLNPDSSPRLSYSNSQRRQDDHTTC